jgi:hypothetical protein
VLPERSKERAHKLLDYINNRRGRRTGVSPSKQGDHFGNLIRGKRNDYSTIDKGYSKYSGGDDYVGMDHVMKKYGEKRKVPLRKIVSAQNTVSVSGVHKKIDRKGPNTPSVPYFVHHKPTDTYHLADGNHRVNSARLKRQSHIDGKVLSVESRLIEGK